MMSARDAKRRLRIGDKEREGVLARGRLEGMAMAAAVLARDFGQATMASEILGAAGLDTADAVLALDLDRYDAAPLLQLVK